MFFLLIVGLLLFTVGLLLFICWLLLLLLLLVILIIIIQLAQVEPIVHDELEYEVIEFFDTLKAGRSFQPYKGPDWQYRVTPIEVGFGNRKYKMMSISPDVEWWLFESTLADFTFVGNMW
jgi:hypothetical protein